MQRKISIISIIILITLHLPSTIANHTTPHWDAVAGSGATVTSDSIGGFDDFPVLASKNYVIVTGKNIGSGSPGTYVRCYKMPGSASDALFSVNKTGTINKEVLGLTEVTSLALSSHHNVSASQFYFAVNVTFASDMNVICDGRAQSNDHLITGWVLPSGITSADNMVNWQRNITSNSPVNTIGYLFYIPTITFTKLANSATLPPTGGSDSVAWSPDGTHVAISSRNTPYLTVYSVSGTTFTKLADPATLPTGSAFGVAWNPSSNMLAVAHATTPYVTIYSLSGTTLTKIANPSTLPGSDARGVDWKGDYLGVGHSLTPFFTIYSVSGTTFTKLANPATLPAGSLADISFNSDATLFTVSTNNPGDPCFLIYSRSGSTLTKEPNAGTLCPGISTGWKAQISPNNDYFAIAISVSPFIQIYSISGVTFTKLSDPASLPAGAGKGAAWSPDNNYLTIAHDTSPFITNYERSGSTFIKLTNPASVPSTGPSQDAAWSPNGAIVSLASFTTPFIHNYAVNPPAVTSNSISLQIKYCQAPIIPGCTSPGSWAANDTVVNASIPGTNWYQNGTANYGWFNLTRESASFNNSDLNIRLSNSNFTIYTITYNLSNYHPVIDSDLWNLYVGNTSLSVTISPNPGSFVVPNPALFHINKTTDEIVYWTIFKVENSGSVTMRTTLYPIEEVTSIARYPQSGSTTNTTGLANHTGQYFLAIANTTGNSIINVPFVICSTASTCPSQPTINSALNTTIQTTILSNIQVVQTANQAVDEEESKGLILTAADFAYGSYFSECDCVLDIPNMYYFLILCVIGMGFLIGTRRRNEA